MEKGLNRAVTPVVYMERPQVEKHVDDTKGFNTILWEDRTASWL